MLGGLGWSTSVLDRLWPSSQVDELSQPKFIHDHASVDADSSLLLVDLEQRRVMTNLSQYFEAIRRNGSIPPLRDASRKLLSDITEFLDDLQAFHPAQGVEERNSMMNRQKLLAWLEEVLGVLCEMLAEGANPSALDQFRTSIRESVDSVLLSLLDAMETDDAMAWDIAKQLTGDRGAMMRRVRTHYLEMDPPLRRNRADQPPSDHQCRGRDILRVVEGGERIQRQCRNRGACSTRLIRSFRKSFGECRAPPAEQRAHRPCRRFSAAPLSRMAQESG